MSERAGQILRIACLLLAAWVVYELAGMVPRVNPLSHVVIPALPTLAADTNNAPPIAGAKTNVATSAAKGANKPGELASTNAPAHKSTNAAGSNVVTSVQVATAKTNPAPVEMTATNSTNAAIAAEAAPVDVTARTNSSMVATNISTNVPNVISAALVTPVEENPGTILVTRTNLTSTNVTMPQAATGSNASNSQAVLVSGTNRPAAAQARGRGTNGPAGMARAGMPPNARAAALPELPPDIKARVDRIYDSEILGQIVRPLPMALMGIAGDYAFLRTATGQTGMIKAGEALGELKLVQIGINRVLVEQSGKKQELMIFEGYGGTSLLPREKENPQ